MSCNVVRIAKKIYLGVGREEIMGSEKLFLVDNAQIMYLLISTILVKKNVYGMIQDT